jgi:hypothetical protein
MSPAHLARRQPGAGGVLAAAFGPSVKGSVPNKGTTTTSMKRLRKSFLIRHEGRSAQGRALSLSDLNSRLALPPGATVIRVQNAAK